MIRIRITDVAKKAGVSTTTVSRVINNERYVSEEKRKLVEKAIGELGYSPNRMARSLVRQKTNLIGVIVPQVNLSFYYSIITTMERVAFEQGYNLFICNTIHNAKKELQYLKLCKELRVDGLILMHEQLHEDSIQFIKDWGIEAVSASGEMDGIDIPSILVDNRKAAKEITTYLINMGHRHIHFIAGSKDPHATLTTRLSGFYDAIKESNEDIQFEVEYGDYSIMSGYKAMEKFIQSGNIPTAIFAISDDMAIGAINCMKEYGIKVPEEISVVGFDGSDISRHFLPRLTTVEQPIDEIGEQTILSLIKLINGEKIKERMIIPYHLSIGDSCFSPKGGGQNTP